MEQEDFKTNLNRRGMEKTIEERKEAFFEEMTEDVLAIKGRSIWMNLMTETFNEWALRYAQNPEKFGEVLDEDGKPVEDYGKRCAIYFTEIATELDDKGLLPI